MNFVKRAAYSLAVRRGKTAILLGIFLVICTLLLGGFLLQGATARQEAEAQRRIGVDVTVRGERLTGAKAAKLGSSSLVERYNAVRRESGRAPGVQLVEPAAPPPPGERGGEDRAAVTGVRDSSMLIGFATGRTTLVDGRQLTAKDGNANVVLVERRLAEKNGLRPGDRIALGAPDGKGETSFEIVGIYQDPTEVPSEWRPPAELGANQIYAPVGALARLGFGAGLDEAVFKLGSPERAEALHTRAERLLGGDGFRFDVNDKAYRDQVAPLRRVGAFASAVVWLIAVAGAVVLGLIVALTIRERRDELGMLLSLGEKKWKLIGQHTVEVAAVAVPALALAALVGGIFAEQAGERLLSQDGGQSARADLAPGSDAALPPPDMRMRPGDLGRVAGIGLGISLVSTAIPGIGILRMHPRSILTDSE